MSIRTGDTVLHKPSGEKWLVAYVQGEYLAWCGGPEGEAKLADCELGRACTDEQHWKPVAIQRWKVSSSRTPAMWSVTRALACK